MSYHTIPYHIISYHIISYHIISYIYTWYISQRWAQTFLKYPLYPSIVIECIRTTLNCSSLPVMQPCWLFWPNSNNRNIKENSIKHSPFLVSRGRDFRTDAWRILTVQPHLVMKYKAVQQKTMDDVFLFGKSGLKPWSLYLNLAEVSFPIIHFWENRIS